MEPNSTQGKPSKRFLSDRDVNAIYGLKPGKLKKMRILGIGPEFRRFGHRTVLYDAARLEQWIESLPSGGGKLTA